MYRNFLCLLSPGLAPPARVELNRSTVDPPAPGYVYSLQYIYSLCVYVYPPVDR